MHIGPSGLVPDRAGTAMAPQPFARMAGAPHVYLCRISPFVARSHFTENDQIPSVPRELVFRHPRPIQERPRMDLQPDRKALKREILSALDVARADFSTHVSQARKEYNPKAIISQSFQKNKAVWSVGAAILGFAITRYFFRKPPIVKIARDNKTESVKKRTMSGIVRAGLWSLASAQVMEIAKSRLQAILLERVQQHFQKPPR